MGPCGALGHPRCRFHTEVRDERGACGQARQPGMTQAQGLRLPSGPSNGQNGGPPQSTNRARRAAQRPIQSAIAKADRKATTIATSDQVDPSHPARTGHQPPAGELGGSGIDRVLGAPGQYEGHDRQHDRQEDPREDGADQGRNRRSLGSRDHRRRSRQGLSRGRVAGRWWQRRYRWDGWGYRGNWL